MAMLPNAAQHIYNLAMTQLPTMVTMTAQTDNPPSFPLNCGKWLNLIQFHQILWWLMVYHDHNATGNFGELPKQTQNTNIPPTLHHHGTARND